MSPFSYSIAIGEVRKLPNADLLGELRIGEQVHGTRAHEEIEHWSIFLIELSVADKVSQKGQNRRTYRRLLSPSAL